MDLERPTILLVEDEADIRQGLKDILEGAGYSVRAFADGAQAMKILRSDERPALILLDMIMPGMNGLSFCHEVKHDPKLADIPVILVSATVHEGAFPTCDAVAELRKPVDIPRLLDAIERHARRIPEPPHALGA